ncbi:MAG: hypothetical protein IT497_04665 [Ottowia sp.]|nr:hypothetical protein [Ottowia sp.]
MPESKNQDGELDIFDIRQPIVSEGLVPVAEEMTLDSPSIKQGTRSNFLLRLKPVHFVVALLSMAFLWISAPHIFSSQEKVLNDTQEIPMNTSMMERNHSLAESEQVINTSQNDLPNANFTESNSLPDLAAQTEKNQVVDLQDQVDTLQKKIAQMEAKPVQCTTTASIRKKKLASHPLKIKTQAPSQIASDYVTKEIVHADFKINTIYRDQVWIKNTKEDRIHLVQAGDVIGDMRVLQIEPEARRVVTTSGDIR